MRSIGVRSKNKSLHPPKFYPNLEDNNHCMQASDDPYVPIADTLRDELNAETIKMENMKHFSGDDGIKELPIVLNKLLEISR